MSRLVIKTKNGTKVAEATFDSVADIYKKLTETNKHLNKDRIRLTTGRLVALTLGWTGVADARLGFWLNAKVTAVGQRQFMADVLLFKDLGPQISWKTVFLLEYFGPILIHMLFCLYPKFWWAAAANLPGETVVLIGRYGIDAKPFGNTAQLLGFVMVQLHFLKREYETEHVHRFSNATMPWTNLPKNCFHYWILGGLFIAYPLYKPGYSPLFEITSKPVLGMLVAIWVFAQWSNFKTHTILRDLRPAGSMYSWAVKKHKNYKVRRCFLTIQKEFPDYPKSRKVLVPFVV
ncbi:3-oxo-5a-steroid 4- dehydrogenase [Kappamyces sp. JEL0680]|nr:3-oxo-5a-steroid 4- dehydrogenase [Kappamyces sp. JEL0680]